MKFRFGEIAKAVVSFRISKEANEIAWDAFLANATPGCHSQAGLWAQVKAAQGWKSIRLIGQDGSQIVGGAQVLYRTTPILGGIGYVKRGPVLAESNTELAGDLIEELIRLARSLRLRALYVEPPADQIDCKDEFKINVTKDTTITVKKNWAQTITKDFTLTCGSGRCIGSRSDRGSTSSSNRRVFVGVT